MRKIAAFLAGLATLTLLLAGLTSASTAEAKDLQGLRILASFLPVYIFTQNVIQGVPGVSVEMMLPPGTGCPHNYTLTPGDLKKIASSSILITNGLGIERFVGPAVLAANPNIKVIDSSRGIKTRPEKASHRHRKDHLHPVNPHIWMSPALVAFQVDNIAEGLAAFDPGHAKIYRQNAARYTARLEKLASELKKTAAALRNQKIVTSHSAFDYLARDLGLTVVAYMEEDSSPYPSGGKLDTLIRTIKKEKVAALFIDTRYPRRLAEVISRESGVSFYVLNPVTAAQHDFGPDYYEDIMRENLALIRKALGEIR